MTTIRIRSARPDDAVVACEVIRQSIKELCEADHGNDEVFLALWLANKIPKNVVVWITDSHVFLAEENDQVVGVAALTGSGHITLNYVAPEARFRGVSKALLQALENKARELGCQACTLESTKTAASFYRAAGYREAGEGVLTKSLAGLQGSYVHRERRTGRLWPWLRQQLARARSVPNGSDGRLTSLPDWQIKDLGLEGRGLPGLQGKSVSYWRDCGYWRIGG
jgi:N-acetylglutamate synthase-like GNAT family acetyltransferase